MKRRIRVDLGDRSYTIDIGYGILDTLGAACRRHHVPEDVVILADTSSARAGLRNAVTSLRNQGFRTLELVFPAGERQKSFARAERIHSFLLKARVPRRAALVALGGGVVGDVGGFVASTYRRGISLIQCPTTLLSQVDSSVGGKNGVNHPSGKNAVGSYLQPLFVLSDLRLLRSLPRREVVSGMGEIIKYPFVGDPSLLDLIEKKLSLILKLHPPTILEIASRCLAIKARLVSRDERETKKNGRKLLNVGHAVAHPLETLSHYRLRHGEAVFLGLMVECSVAVERGWLDPRHLKRLTGIYHALQCRFSLRPLSPGSIVRSVFSAPYPTFVLPRKFGTLEVVNDVTGPELLRAVRSVRTL